MTYDQWKTTNPADEWLGPEQEAEQDIRDAEQAVDDWLHAWSEDFWSDEWAEALTA